jgi:hypothetical protein
MSAAKDQIAGLLEEKAATERKFGEERTEFQARMARLAAEKESERKSALEKLNSLKAALEKTALAEQAAAQQLATARADIAGLQKENAALGKSLSEARSAALKESERFAGERIAASKEFAGELSALQEELNRSKAEKESLERAMKKKPSFGRGTEARREPGGAKVLPLPSGLLKGCGFGGLLLAVGILAYAMVPCREPASSTSPAAEANSTRQIALPGTGAKLAQLPPESGPSYPSPASVPVVAPPSVAAQDREKTPYQEKRETATRVVRKKSHRNQEARGKPATRSARRHQGSGNRSVRRDGSYLSAEKEESTLRREPRRYSAALRPAVKTFASGSSSAFKPPPRKPVAMRCENGFQRWWQRLMVQRREPPDSDMRNQKEKKKYKVDMHPFARY